MRIEFTLTHAIEAIAVLAAAFSGFAEARNKKMDVVGVFTIAFITAFGGGTLRDLLLDRRPFFWVDHYEYVIVILVLTLVATPLLRVAKRVVPDSAFVAADAIGLGFFSVAGTALALEADMPFVVAAMMGVITGVFGGVLRDVICNEVPLVFRDGKPYAITAFFGCVYYLLALDNGMPDSLAQSTGAGLIVALRLIAWRSNWTIR